MLSRILDALPFLIITIGLLHPITLTDVCNWTLSLSEPVLCHLPVASSIPFCHRPQESSSAWNALAFLLQRETSGFERLLDESAVTYSLALDLGEARIAAGDLLPLVRNSHLTHRDELCTLLEGFADDAKDTSRYLQQLTARILSGSDR